jgi:small subunit ribosomal protein S1
VSDEARLKLSDIKPKQELQGIVKRIELAGAVIDVNAEAEALLHISQIKSGRVKNVGDHLKEGEEITVWVRKVDAEKGTISVTMIKPAALAWNEIKEGQVLTGKVVRIEKFGVFVDVGAERPGLVHISELSAEYVNSASDVVAKGADVEVKVIGLNRKKNQIDLSMKALQVPAKIEVIEEEETSEKLPTAMELAFAKAQKKQDKDERPGAASKRDRQAEKREELLRRTLQRMENQ